MYIAFSIKAISLIFFILTMHYQSCKILSETIFYGLIFSFFLQIAGLPPRLSEPVPKSSKLKVKTITHGGNKASILSQIKKDYKLQGI